MVGSISSTCQLWGWCSQPRAPSVSAPWWLLLGFHVDPSSTCCSPNTWVGGKFQRGGWSLSSYLKDRLFKNSLILLVLRCLIYWEIYIAHALDPPTPIPFSSQVKVVPTIAWPGACMTQPSGCILDRVSWVLYKKIIHTLELLNLYELLDVAPDDRRLGWCPLLLDQHLRRRSHKEVSEGEPQYSKSSAYEQVSLVSPICS